jgi:hypothetical protein
MAELRARKLRQQQLSSLDLQYPLWIFEADDPRWPRRLTSLLPTSHPAQITRWVASYSEYALHLSPLQDISSNNQDAAPMTREQHAKLAQSALTQLRYDDTYNSDSLQVIFDERGEQITKQLSSWVFDNHRPDWTDPTNVLRIERARDRVPLWDPKHGLTSISDSDTSHPIFGIATLVADDDELVFAAEIQKTDGGEGIRKAEFQCLDAGAAGGFVKGVICPPRWIEPGDQGLMVHRGPKDKRNQQLLAGTLLQNAAWEDVVEYAKGMRPEPLWR